jgi:exonuclease SbcC
MWRLKEAWAQNFMTFDDLHFKISRGIVTVVFGENKDNDSQKSNGAGKSALLEIIAAGTTGGPLRKIKNGEMVQNGKKQCNLGLIYYNDQTKEELKTEWVFYPKKSAQAIVSVNGVVKDDLTSTNEARAFIEEKLGINEEDLFNFFFLSKSRFEGFLDASDTKKKETINRFSNGYLVDSALEELELDIKAKKEEVSAAEVLYNQLIGKVEGVKESIQDALMADNSSKDVKEQLEELTTLITTVEGELAVKEAAVELQYKELDKAEAKVEKLNKDDKVTKLKKTKEEAAKEAKLAHNDITALKEELSETRIKIKEIESKIEGSVDCPKCSHTFSILDADFDIKKAKQDLKDLKQDEQEIIEEGKEARKDYDKYQQEIAAIEEKIREIEETKEEALNLVYILKRSISKYEGEVAGHRSRIESLRAKISSLHSKEEKDVITPLRERLAALEPQLKEKEQALQEVKAGYESYVEQKDVFKRFKTHLANKSIKTIESITNDYLELIGSDIQIGIEGETELAGGQTRNKISATLYRDGVELGSFNKNSNGEKARINLATILTMNKLINLNAGEGKGLDLMIIDEILDAADAAGLMSMIKAMNKLGLTVLMVSHGALDANYEHTVTVQKEFGKSVILN